MPPKRPGEQKRDEDGRPRDQVTALRRLIDIRQEGNAHNPNPI
jgi:hypothetical protein